MGFAVATNTFLGFLAALPLAVNVSLGPVRWKSLPPAWMLVLVIIAAFLWMRALYSRERGRATGLQRLGLAGLRTLILICVLLILSGPFREETRSTVEPSHLVVLIDNSASMDTIEEYPAAETRRLLESGWEASERPGDLSKTSRGDLVRQYLSPKGEAMLREWNERFVLHVFSFDGDWRSLGHPREVQPTDDETRGDDEAERDPVLELADRIRGLEFTGGRTRLGAVLRNVASEFARRPDRPLAGVLLITDGRDTSDGEPPLAALAAMGPVKEELHVTPVLVGNPASDKNLWVEPIQAKDVVLVDDEVVFESSVRHQQFDGLQGVDVELRAERIIERPGGRTEVVPYKLDRGAADRRTRTREQLDPLPGPDRHGDPVPVPVRMRATFGDAGNYRVYVKAVLPAEARADDSVVGDNEEMHKLRVMDTRIKVLYVAGQPTWDWRFLSNHLTREPPPQRGDVRKHNRFEVNVLLQAADPKYEQPASAGIRSIKSFPATWAELFSYDVIIMGDADWRKFSPRGQAESRKLVDMLVRFVEQGGGLALQAGTDYHNPVDFLETPLAQLVPVAVNESDERISDRGPFIKPFRLDLTDSGRSNPIFAVVPGTRDEPIPSPDLIARTWRGETPLSEDWQWYWLYKATGGLRPGAIDLARVARPTGPDFLDDRGLPFVVFAAMNFGKGRVFWSSLDTISRIRREHRNEFYGAFWEQVIRYLATYRLLGGNTRLKIFTDKPDYFVGETATVTVLALDEQYEPETAPWLDGVHVEDPGGEARALLEDARPRSQAEEGAPGTYRFYIPVRKEGSYRIWIDPGRGVGASLRTSERPEHPFEAYYRAAENVKKMPDLELLKGIRKEANPSGRAGEVLRLPDLAEYVQNMQTRERERVLERTEKTMWDKWWVLVLITFLLAVEWLLRKRWQMI